MARVRGAGRGLALALRLSQHPHAAGRAHGAVSPRHRRGHRHRREGDVLLARRAERRGADAAPGRHRLLRARRDRAQPAARGAQAALVRRADVPPRAPAEGALPAVPPVRGRGAGLRGPGRGRRAHRDVRRAVARARAGRHPPGAEQHRLARGARALPRRPGEAPGKAPRPARRRRQAPAAHQSAAHARLQEPHGAGGNRRRARAHGLPRR
mgnify:CR=1 FL=1